MLDNYLNHFFTCRSLKKKIIEFFLQKIFLFCMWKLFVKVKGERNGGGII